MRLEGLSARSEILARVRTANSAASGASFGRTSGVVVPAAARVAGRVPGDAYAEIERLLSEIEALGGHVRRFKGAAEPPSALAELVNAVQIKRAVMWQTVELQSLGLPESLARLGVEVVGPDASLREIAACDLGITGVDAALPDTGSLLLRAGPDRPRTASLLPPVHLAILTPAALRANLHQILADCRGTACATLITGPSRTSDIELTLTIGVHGPKVLHVWVLEKDAD
jgi:L-lactate dehydrogenase complex protein LldG